MISWLLNPSSYLYQWRFLINKTYFKLFNSNFAKIDMLSLKEKTPQVTIFAIPMAVSIKRIFLSKHNVWEIVLHLGMLNLVNAVFGIMTQYREEHVQIFTLFTFVDILLSVSVIAFNYRLTTNHENEMEMEGNQSNRTFSPARRFPVRH